ncbi:MAG: Pycsar system effector family protein [Chitinophagales bacterium]
MEYVLCDADLSGIASKKYFESANFLRQEQELVLNKKYTDLEWIKLEIEFLTHHKFHTPYCYLAFEKRKINHILELKKMMEELEETEAKQKTKKSRKEVENTAKENRPERGIETVFRLTLNNHMNFWKTADDKGNFLLAVNSIMLVFALVNVMVIPQLTISFLLLVPVGILLLVCLLSIVFTILSMQPKHYSGNTTVEDIEKKNANLMFFGNFQKMKPEEFSWGFKEMMKDREFLYGSMIRELYYLGKVLGRKYFLLRIAYALFMWGIIVTVLSYVAVYCYFYLFFLQW